MNFCSDEYCIGDLVCFKSYTVGDSESWVGINPDVGIVLEIIEVGDSHIFYEDGFRCYDIVIYWCLSGQTSTMPDILVEKFEKHVRRVYAK
mgnify:CR=1 FL=1